MTHAQQFLLIWSHHSTIIWMEWTNTSSSHWRWKRTTHSYSWISGCTTIPDGSILTSVYTKPTHTDCYLDFSSHHPLEHKRSVVITLFSRANSLTSTMLQRMGEESHISKKLKINRYPQCFICKQQGDKRTSKPDEPRREPKASTIHCGHHRNQSPSATSTLSTHVWMHAQYRSSS